MSLLQSCSQISQVSQIHGHMVKTALDCANFNVSKVLASSIGDLNYAFSIFYSAQNPNLFMYNTMLRCYSVSEKPQGAFGLFNHLRASGILLDQFSFITTLKSCALTSAIETGLSIHGDAHQLFDELPQRRDLVSWNTLMGGYLNISQPGSVVALFRILRRSYVGCNVATVVNVLSALGDVGNCIGGELLHGYCIKIAICLELNVITALISMYGKTGYINSGRRVFDGVLKKDVILWNCIIYGYAKNGFLEESLSLLRLMRLEGLKLNSSTLAGVLSACAASEAGGVGQCIGDFVEEEQLVLDAVLGTALLDMYSKCGFLEKAVEVFNRMESKDVKTWTAMISAYGAHGHAKSACALFHRMEGEGYWPNEVTFLTVLSACSHGGFVKEGMDCIYRMVQVYGIAPTVVHYGCIIDLLGRAGLLGQALDLIESLPIEVDATVWRALLAACRVHGNVELGDQVKRVLTERYDEHPTDSILLSGSYAMAGRLPDDALVQEMKGKERGGSSIWVTWNEKRDGEEGSWIQLH
ncbi:hypothetical protein Nepgr_003546 [Nepenthes gracilis]|uniref:Pentatricopeptide repeat-containing protein n=1 Tax=Nepenthes gracilis TaxID=150966 RepID=A0AAD3XDU1_NEPGR|nr:hypothetical protein Nepgr_003546 [Nepenthes gracilis]